MIHKRNWLSQSQDYLMGSAHLGFLIMRWTWSIWIQNIYLFLLTVGTVLERRCFMDFFLAYKYIKPGMKCCLLSHAFTTELCPWMVGWLGDVACLLLVVGQCQIKFALFNAFFYLDDSLSIFCPSYDS